MKIVLDIVDLGSRTLDKEFKIEFTKYLEKVKSVFTINDDVFVDIETRRVDLIKHVITEFHKIIESAIHTNLGVFESIIDQKTKEIFSEALNNAVKTETEVTSEKALI